MKIEMDPLSSVEAKKIVETSEDEEKDVLGFLKKFVKLNDKKAGKLKEDLESLDIIKLKKEHIAKIIDFLPEDASDVNKIFTDVSLDENETNKILEVVKTYR